MKVYLQNDKVLMDDNGTITEVTSFKKDSKDPNKIWACLPENSINRQFISMDLLNKKQMIDYGDTIKEKRTLTRTETTHKLPAKWIDFATDDEKAIIEQIMKDCTTRMNDPIEKAKREVERAKAVLAKLQNEKEAK